MHEGGISVVQDGIVTTSGNLYFSKLLSGTLFVMCGQADFNIIQVPQGNLYMQYSGLNALQPVLFELTVLLNVNHLQEFFSI